MLLGLAVIAAVQVGAQGASEFPKPQKDAPSAAGPAQTAVLAG